MSGYFAQWPNREINHRSVNDNVHGHMTLYRPLDKIVDTKAFQRLNKLKQLGLTYLVYPSAVHTRLAHSIGTYWLAYKLVKHLKDYQPSLNITAEDHLCVCIAALCHDIGHGPFSHLFDSEKFRNAVNSRAPLHETVSQNLIRQLMDDLHEHFKSVLGDGLRYERNVIFIMELVEGQKLLNEIGEFLPKGRDIYKSFLYDIVSNKHNGFDVDKYDYLIRDCTNAGEAISLNMASIECLISNSKVCEVKEANNAVVLHICYKEEVINHLHQVTVARQRLHNILCQTPKKEIIEHMVVDVLVLADKHLLYKGDNEQEYCLSKVTENMGAFLETSDYVLEQIQQSTCDDLSGARETLKLIERGIIPHMVDHVTYESRKCLTETIQKEMLKKLGETEFKNFGLLLLSRDLNRGRQDDDPMLKVLLYDRRGKAKNVPGHWLNSWKSAPRVRETVIYVGNEHYKEQRDKIKRHFQDVIKEQGLQDLNLLSARSQADDEASATTSCLQSPPPNRASTTAKGVAKK